VNSDQVGTGYSFVVAIDIGSVRPKQPLQFIPQREVHQARFVRILLPDSDSVDNRLLVFPLLELLEDEPRQPCRAARRRSIASVPGLLKRELTHARAEVEALRSTVW
jgi:hypothetical protein